jgi:hypothetical protein
MVSRIVIVILKPMLKAVRPVYDHILNKRGTELIKSQNILGPWMLLLKFLASYNGEY